MLGSDLCVKYTLVFGIAGCNGLSWMQAQITSQNLCRWREFSSDAD